MTCGSAVRSPSRFCRRSVFRPGAPKTLREGGTVGSALIHPNIVTIYDIGSSEGVSFIAMERVEGKTLRELLFGGTFPVKRLLQVEKMSGVAIVKFKPIPEPGSSPRGSASRFGEPQPRDIREILKIERPQGGVVG